jgi:hypothetical protein
MWRTSWGALPRSGRRPSWCAGVTRKSSAGRGISSMWTGGTRPSYDLVINTKNLSMEAAVDLVLRVLPRPELAATEASRQTLRDRVLAARVRAALAAHPDTRRHWILQRGSIPRSSSRRTDTRRYSSGPLSGEAPADPGVFRPPPAPSTRAASSPSARRDRFPRQGDPPLAMGPGSAMLVPGLDEHTRSSAEGLECASPSAAGAGGDRWIETMDTRRGP